MKKISSQIIMGIVCLILGVMIAFQFKVNNNPKKNSYRQVDDMAKEIESLKKHKDELTKQVSEYQKKVDEYEAAAADVSLTAKKMKEELEGLRKLAGLTDVEGEGIVITLTSDISVGENITETDVSGVNYLDIIDIVNEINSSKVAEAISINEERYTGRTQIRPIANVIMINDLKVSPYDTFTIKAIGDPDVLEAVFKMPENILDILKAAGFKVKCEKAKDIKILKYNKKLEFNYIK